MISKGPMAVAIVAVLALVVIMAIPAVNGVDGADDLSSSNTTVYIDTEKGVDTNNGLSKDNPVKTFAQALEIATNNDTIMVTGDVKSQIPSISKPLTIIGDGDGDGVVENDDLVHVTASVSLPTATGKVTFENFSFDGSSTFNSYGNSTGSSELELVIKNCEFTQAGANCVFIVPEINSLTVTGCTFDAVDLNKYDKQYLIWPSYAKNITITNNKFNGSGEIRAPIHLGEGHKDGTTALISGNTFNNFDRCIQIAFTNDNTNSVKISNNTFEDIVHLEGGSEAQEVATVFIHENLKKGTTTIDYTDNKLTGGSETMFYSENEDSPAEDVVDSKTFTGNTINGIVMENVSDSSSSKWVAMVGSVEYTSLKEAISDAKDGNNRTITLLSNIFEQEWTQEWNLEDITIDGNGHTIKVNGIESGQNHDSLFHSAGGNTFKNMTIDLSGIVSDSQAQGNRAFSAAPGDVFQNVTIIGNEHVSYGITVGGTSSDDETVTIEDCRFVDLGYGVYDSETGDVENLVITGSEFAGCGYAVILHSKFAEFVGNDVSGGRVNILDNAQKVTDNSFTNESRIKFYTAGPTFERNSISGDSYLASDEDVSGIDVSSNYWGGGAPSQSQLAGTGATYGDFYLDEDMTRLNTDPVPGYEEDDELPPFIPQQSAEDDDTTLYIACCAAAAVVALLAIIIVMNERKR